MFGVLMRGFGILTAGVMLAVSLAMPAAAHYYHPGKGCSANQQILIESRSAGQTYHQKEVGSYITFLDHGVVSTLSPYRAWWTGDRNVLSWGAQAYYLESHSAVCRPQFSQP